MKNYSNYATRKCCNSEKMLWIYQGARISGSGEFSVDNLQLVVYPWEINGTSRGNFLRTLGKSPSYRGFILERWRSYNIIDGRLPEARHKLSLSGRFQTLSTRLFGRAVPIYVLTDFQIPELGFSIDYRSGIDSIPENVSTYRRCRVHVM